MKKLNKILGVFGMMVLMVGVLSACSNSPSDDRSTPEASMENYMETVKSGEIEESHKFIYETVIESNTGSNPDELVFGDEWDEKIKETKGYKTYKKELTKIYNNLEYEITDTHEKEGFDQTEFIINLTMVNFEKVNSEIIEEIAGNHLGEILSSKDEKDILKGFDKMYGEIAKALQNMDGMTDTISGYLIFVETGTAEDEFEREWVISGMDYELFKQLAEKQGL